MFSFDFVYFFKATFRLVLNLEGEELNPSDKWSFTRYEKLWAFKFDSPIDLTYKRSVPVMIMPNMSNNEVIL